MSELTTSPRFARPSHVWAPPPLEQPADPSAEPPAARPPEGPMRTTADRLRLRGLLLPIQWFLAAGWLRAAVEKVVSADWWTGAALDTFLVEQRPQMIGFFPAIVDLAIAPFALSISWIVIGMQLLIGLALLTGRHLAPALWGGVALNTTFVLAGAVNPSAFYLMMQLVLLLAIARPVAWRTSVRRAAGWLAAAAATLPFVRTVDPALVIDDPASMLAFGATLAAVGTLATGDWHRVPALARWLTPETSRSNQRLCK